MGLHDPFGWLKHKLWLKERSRVKLAIWLSTTKSRELPWFPYVQVACNILLESLKKKGIILLQTLFQSKVCTQNYGLPKLQESQFWKFRNSHLVVLRQNDIWVLAMWPNKKYTIRRKVVASPKFGSWWVLWVCVCLWFVCVYLWFVHAPKVLYLCINQLVV